MVTLTPGRVSVLGHFLPNSIFAIKDVINFTQQVSFFLKQVLD